MKVLYEGKNFEVRAYKKIPHRKGAMTQLRKQGNFTTLHEINSYVTCMSHPYLLKIMRKKVMIDKGESQPDGKPLLAIIDDPI